MCLGDLTGVDFPGEKHPKTCPCDIARQKERLDQERAERRREEEHASPNEAANVSPSSAGTCRALSRSLLLPTCSRLQDRLDNRD